jgi:acyl-CoA dehydrogenase
MDLDVMLGAETGQLREAVRSCVAPFDLKYWERKDAEHAYPHELWRALAQAGWVGVAIPEEYGGAGLGMREMAVVIEEACRAGGGSTVAQLFMLTPVFGGVSIERHGSEEQRRRFLPGIASGDLTFCMALTEPEAGSNTLATRTTAVEDGDGWRIDGQKIWISGVEEADWMLIVARTTRAEDAPRRSHGLSLFLAPAHDPAISAQPIDKLGTHTVGSYTVFFDGLRLPKDALLGERDQGWQQILSTLNTERIVTAAGCVAAGDLALDISTKYVTERSVFGRKIGSNQGIAFPLARAKIDLELARLMNYKAAWLYDRREDCGAEANMAKLAAAEAGFAAADRSIQALGGMGYARETGLERLWRDIRLFGFAPVSEELILAYVAQSVLGLPRSY